MDHPSECDECELNKKNSFVGCDDSSSDHTLTSKVVDESVEEINVIEEPVIWSSTDELDLTKSTLNKTFSQSTIIFQLDPNAKKKTTKIKVLTPEEEEIEKINKFRLFQIECAIKEADKMINNLSVQNLLLISQKKRRDADLQRYEAHIGDKMIKKNCVRHNWELFETQEHYRELRGKHVIDLTRLRHIKYETKQLQKKVDYLAVLADKSDREALDDLDHLIVRKQIQEQLYNQEFVRLNEEKMVLGRDLRLLEENHHKVLTMEREKLKSLTQEHEHWKNLYIKLLEKNENRKGTLMPTRNKRL